MQARDISQVHTLGSVVEEFRAAGGSPCIFWPQETLEAIVREEIAYVVEDDQKVVGFLIATYQPSVRKLTWQNMYLMPQYRGQAIAHACWELAEQEARKRGATYVCSLIEEGNFSSIRMLERAGFRQGKKYIWMEKVL
jgi:ribosomal protein S18 acetylase RimI-like enzyme